MLPRYTLNTAVRHDPDVLWVCACPAPNHVRTRPGQCPSCNRFPHLVSIKPRKVNP